MKTVIAATAAAALLGAVLLAAPCVASAAPGEVAVVVSIPIPKTVPRAALPAEFDKAAPLYRAIPGLKRKYFTLGDGEFGGIYLWNSRAAAQAWFNEAWTKRATATYGAAPTVTWFDAPLVIEGTKP